MVDQPQREQAGFKAKQESYREVGGDAEPIHRVAGNRQQRGEQPSADEQHGEWIGHEVASSGLSSTSDPVGNRGYDLAQPSTRGLDL